MAEIIAYSGTHGTGKTTAAYKRAVELKRCYPGKSVHALVDQEAFCPYSINGDTSPAAQLWIFSSILNLELSLMNRFDVIVSDRTAVDAVAYTYVAGFESLATDMLTLAGRHMQIYERITVRKIVHNEFCHHDGIRDAADRSFRQQVEDTLLQMYDSLIDSGALSSEALSYE